MDAWWDVLRVRERSGRLKTVKARKEEQLKPVAVCALLAAGCCFKGRSRFATATSGELPGSLTNGGRSEGTVAADKKGKSTAVMQSGSSDHGSHSTWRRNYMPLKSPHLTRITSANQTATAPVWCWSRSEGNCAPLVLCVAQALRSPNLPGGGARHST